MKFIKLGLSFIALGCFMMVCILVLDLKNEYMIMSSLAFVLLGGFIISAKDFRKNKCISKKLGAFIVFLLSFSLFWTILYVFAKSGGYLISENIDFILLLLNSGVMGGSLFIVLRESKKARQFFVSLLDVFF
ncbi:uncharacterized protein YneF (UPF0154 family) [Breznakia sp. PF5-3]|uniref:hypothetical protein n=1 Tax=unclassified Breznakia TaxID=2623764 RepID=UPI002405A4AB|nr:MULTISPECIES: hypothetical protein [unclassified Breznakia]MDL2276310.1 hypothetical protein [Breznakia sp. OttesenSCG-928-G09]MDF9825139.1 uncharacterized protein YneF (UPF0154 family) [Breznakia sp. PM6-1]MDF9836002.1 uncharacterized protein YneF (UPF0154 family) [Breznakia sp. PF5-3]MDF9838100.1 uncharacterized protein YneF (UPF0154 family) [Breznakia sp. PFB2-8]MDF9860070.1 uncharacterized protein YneF (UPF0154 family) [Breznakia sp. PH5-24]